MSMLSRESGLLGEPPRTARRSCITGHALAEAYQDEVAAEKCTDRFAIRGDFMPKAKPISLYPLKFEEAIDILLKAPPKTQKKLAPSRSKKQK